MRLVFAGTPAFAVPALDALVDAGHAIAAVYTQPDRPAGRGRKLQASAVATRAAALALPVRKPERLDAPATAELRALAADAMVVVAYGLLLPPAVLDAPRLGCFNIHASLLPRWRGAAPIARCILAGDRDTGVTIMRMDAGLDTGPMLLQEAVPIPGDATAGDLAALLAPLGARLIVEALARLERGTAPETPQPAGATYARKLDKDEARLDWTRSAADLARCIRAFNPAPMAWTQLGGERVRVLRAAAADGAASEPPGTIVGGRGPGIAVATGAGYLLITEMQFAGGRPLTWQQLSAGRPLAGSRFDA